MNEEEVGLCLAAVADNQARLVYADWLEEHGRAEEAAKLREGPDALTALLHRCLVGPRLAELEEVRKAANRAREVSIAYWARAEINALSRVGMVRMEIRSRMPGGPAPAGHVLVRPSKGGRYAKSRVDKCGRPLSAAEMVRVLEQERS